MDAPVTKKAPQAPTAPTAPLAPPHKLAPLKVAGKGDDSAKHPSFWKAMSSGDLNTPLHQEVELRNHEVQPETHEVRLLSRPP